MVFGMAWWTSHGIWYGLGVFVMVCGKAEYYMLLGIAICYSPEAIWRSCSHVPERAFYMHVLFTRTAPIHDHHKRQSKTWWLLSMNLRTRLGHEQ